MIKAKHILAAVLVAVVIYACGSDDNGGSSVDPAEQAVVDNDSIVKFLRTHYYNSAVDSVKPLVAGETSLFDDSNLVTQNVTEQDINYKLYVYVARSGMPDPVKGNPSIMDSVLVKYSGQRIVNSDSLSNPFDSNIRGTWLSLGTAIRGWSYGFTNFKGGRNNTQPGDPLSFENGGKGVLFIPSGLAYGQNGNNAIPANASLMFYIDLWDIVEDTDQDGDGIISILEDADGDGNPWNDNTDGDQFLNFLDLDDDNDGKPTREEDRNGDGDPTNDFNDPNNPTLPDYLNPLVFG